MLNLEYWPIEKCMDYSRNPRKNDQVISKMVASINEFGFTIPILAKSDGLVIDGHLRLKAARQLSMKEVPVVIADHLSEAQVKAFRLLANRSANWAEWDDEMLRIELGELKDMNFDLSLTGFEAKELDLCLKEDILSEDKVLDCDDIPEEQSEIKSRMGDIWVIGNHRLMVGDSGNKGDIVRLFENNKATMSFTSPPYLYQRHYDPSAPMNSDWLSLMVSVYQTMESVLVESAQILCNLGYVFKDGQIIPYWMDWIQWMQEHQWRWYGQYVWDKCLGIPIGGFKTRLLPSHELIFHFNKKEVTTNKFIPCKNAGDEIIQKRRNKDGNLVQMNKNSKTIVCEDFKIPDDVIRVRRHTSGLSDAGDHPAVFPIELCLQLIYAFTKKDDLIYEPFSGSGTQILAAEQSNRRCFAMEVSPQYADVAIRRIQNTAGIKAIHQDKKTDFGE